MKTPEELFEEYTSLGDCKRLFDPNQSEESREKQHEIAEQLKETGHIVAWHPDKGSFLFKK